MQVFKSAIRNPQLLRLGILFHDGSLSSERSRQPLFGFGLGSIRIVFRIDGLIVLGHCSLALAQNVVDLAQVNVAPDFNPGRVFVAVQSVAKGIRGSLPGSNRQILLSA